ncbi:F-box domain-containing protein [Mycena kentingensis (nom. inval.)]|nr:F-box domain-containing protein [Mycena kentingensis (nom. inval.)]
MEASPAALRATLLQIDGELASLRAQIDSLSATREATVKQLRAVVYPILTVPSELILAVFDYVVDDSDVQMLSVPLCLARLSSVCTAWRSLVLNSPLLWAKISTLYVPRNDDFATNILHMTEAHLARSGTLPLTVDISYHGSLLPMLLPHASRWRSFECGLTDEIAEQLSNVAPRPLPELQLLKLAGDAQPPQTAVALFRDAPNLRHVELVNLPVAAVALPWAQLRELTLTFGATSEYRNVLRLTPRLETLHVVHEIIDPDHDEDDTPLRMAHLRELTFENADFTYWKRSPSRRSKNSSASPRTLPPRWTTNPSRPSPTLWTALTILGYMRSVTELTVHNLVADTSSPMKNSIFSFLSEFSEPDPADPDPDLLPTPVLLPALQSLYISYEEPFYDASMFMLFRGRKLAKFHLEEQPASTNKRPSAVSSKVLGQDFLYLCPPECDLKISGMQGVIAASEKYKATYTDIAYSLSDIRAQA